jgi:hypothetical protein
MKNVLEAQGASVNTGNKNQHPEYPDSDNHH